MRFFLSKPKRSYVTCRDRDDGGGAQIAACISTMIYARMKGIEYAHTPLSDIAHRPDDMTPDAWAAAWENWFSLGAGETAAADLEAAGMKTARIARPHHYRPRSNRLQIVAHCHRFTNHHPQGWADIAPDLRRKYAITPKPTAFDADHLHIALHLRRGDVDLSGQFAERFTPVTRILPTLDRICGESAGKPVRIHVFSQGDPSDFPELAERGAVFHLDEDVFESFHAMASADVLFTAKSSFSYLAGVIGTGRVIYEPFWHPPLPGWEGLEGAEPIQTEE